MAKEIKFVKGVKVKSVKTKYGNIITVGVKLDEFVENDLNEKGYINFQILESKNGNLYAKIDDYKPKSKDDEEIPF